MGLSRARRLTQRPAGGPKAIMAVMVHVDREGKQAKLGCSGIGFRGQGEGIRGRLKPASLVIAWWVRPW